MSGLLIMPRNNIQKGVKKMDKKKLAKKKLDRLPKKFVDFLKGGKCAVMATEDKDGRPFTALMSWLVAKDEKTIALAVIKGSQALANIMERRAISLEILGDNIIYCVRGDGRVVDEEMKSAPMPSAKVEMTVSEVRDHSAPGVLFKGPSYAFAEGKEHRTEIERSIFKELYE